MEIGKIEAGPTGGRAAADSAEVVTGSRKHVIARRAAELAAGRRPGFSLPQPLYTDPELFEWDIDRVFLRHWLVAGHVSRLPVPGSYFLFEIGGESIVVTRDRDGAVHALWNVCRHRGSRVCRGPEGRATTLVCPYHAWAYAPDGRLVAAPAMPGDFDRAAYGLKRCRVRIAHGIIFVHLGSEPEPDLEPVLADIEPFAAPYRLAEAVLACRMTWEIRANWKLVLENFLECYHCGPAHPEYCSVMDHALANGTQSPGRVEAYKAQQARFETRARALGHFVGAIPPTDARVHAASRIVIGSERLGAGRDGRLNAPLMGDFETADGGYTAFSVLPGFYFLSPCDHAVLCLFIPVAVDRTVQEMLWLVRPGAAAGRDYDADDLTWLWRVTTDQDVQIIEDNQRGVASRAYEPGPYSTAETGPERFARWYLHHLGTVD